MLTVGHIFLDRRLGDTIRDDLAVGQLQGFEG